ncbi:NUDIX hydrolase [Portibacter marinus]|uniref:NUDIX hydrolase n=1 Tax=Portibacter marinus TaxID=2898660 RepID=UPI001F28B074|nr:NUDIX hydrolase [Portibacter marinus]
MEWKVLKSRYISRDKPWFTARVDTVKLPNGEVLENYYVLEYPDWVTVIAITEEDQFVFIEQYRHAYGVTAFELSAGVIDEDDESPLVAGQRELLEETGFGGGQWSHLTNLCANPGTHTNTVHTYVAKGVQKIEEQSLDRTEDINVRLFSREEVLQMIKKDELVQALHVAALLKYFHFSA